MPMTKYRVKCRDKATEKEGVIDVELNGTADDAIKHINKLGPSPGCPQGLEAIEVVKDDPKAKPE